MGDDASVRSQWVLPHRGLQLCAAGGPPDADVARGAQAADADLEVPRPLVRPVCRPHLWTMAQDNSAGSIPAEAAGVCGPSVKRAYENMASSVPGSEPVAAGAHHAVALA
jgi:hypothetical protein